MAKRTVIVCDTPGCGTVIREGTEHFHAVFQSVPGERWDAQLITDDQPAQVHLWSIGCYPDPSGGRDREHNRISLDLCASCARRLVLAVETIAKQEPPA